MALVPLLNLPVAVGLDGNEYIPLVQGLSSDAVTKRATINSIVEAAAAASVDIYENITLEGASPYIRWNSDGPRLTLATTNQLALTNGSAVERMRFDLGNVRLGIGTSAPTSQIDVLATAANSVIKARATTSGDARVEVDSATSSDFSVLLFRQGGTEYGRIQITALGNMAVQATTQIDMRTASTSRLLIDSSGIIDYKQAAVTAGAPFTNTGKVSVKINGVSYSIMLCA